MRPRLLAPLLLIFLLHHAPVGAFQGKGLDPSKEVSQYSRQTWTKKDGLPQNSVRAILQTTEGYLWLGTEEGLVRFDGSKFTTYNRRNTPQLVSNFITWLYEGKDGVLWIGTSGGGVTTLKDRRFSTPYVGDLPSKIPVRTMYQDKARNTWFSTPKGLLCVAADSSKKWYSIKDGLSDNIVTSMVEDSAGHLFVGSWGGISLFEKGRLCTYPLPDGSTPSVKKLYVDRSGDLWILAGKGGVYAAGKNGFRRFSKKEGLPGDEVGSICEDRVGAVWLGVYGAGAVRLYDGQLARFSSEDGLSNDNVQSIAEDREGNLWIGTVGGGLNRLTNGTFTTFPIGKEARGNMAWVVTQTRSGLIAGNELGQLFRLQGKKFVPFRLPGLKFEGSVMAILEDRRGDFWLGTTRGVVHYRKGGMQFHPLGMTSAFAEGLKGDVWVGSITGLYHFVDGKMAKYDGQNGLSYSDVRSLQFDREGTLWICTNGGGVNTLRGEKFGWFTRDSGLVSTMTETIHEAGDGSMWAGSIGGGLSRIKAGKVVTMTSANGLFDDTIYRILEDDSCNFWMTCNNGVFRVKKNELDAFADGRSNSVVSVSYGMNDGMVSDECNGGYQAAGAKTPDGRLWFPTLAGVVMVDPSSLPVNDVPPPVVIEQVSVDRENVWPDGDKVIKAGNGELEFQYAGLSFSSPHTVTFKRKLEGFDPDWVDAGTMRVAYYTNIPPGEYRFRVLACNGNGYWNESGASYVITIPPHFFQTTFFKFLCGACVMLLLATGHHIYRKERDRELVTSRLESQLVQAQLQVLKMQLQPHFLFNTLNGIMVLIKENPSIASRTVARLSEFLRLTLENVGVQEVPLQRELDFLERYLQIEQLRFGDRLTVRQQVCPEAMNAMVPNLILQPLVENAIRHGVEQRRGAAEIRISAERENGSLTIHVSDNGCGLKGGTSQSIKEGVGLSNTRARLEQLYGKMHHLELISPAKGGTDVLLRIPYHEQTDTNL